MQDENIQDKVFEGVGKEVVKGGLIATIDGVRAFIPASQLSTKYIENIAEFVGQPIKLKVIEVDKARKRIVASHKAVMLAEAEEARKQKWAQLEVGAKVLCAELPISVLSLTSVVLTALSTLRMLLGVA